MRETLARRMLAGTMAAVCITAIVAVTPAAAQSPARVSPQLHAIGSGSSSSAVPPLDTERAEQVRDQLRTILQQYPPELGRVLKLDPTLMTNDAYLKPYPMLAAFLAQHPDVPHYSSYFLDFVDIGDYTPREFDARREGMQIWEGTLLGLAILTGIAMALFTLTWLVRYIVNHRRWLRLMKAQSEVHGRLLERLSSNDELMAYIQSPAGTQFLKGAPMPPDTTSPVGAPFGRILWSAQAGFVLIAAGIGLLVIRPYMSVDQVAQMLLVGGVLVLAIGVGFLVASVASYLLSQRLGLLDAVTGGRRPGAA